MKRVWSVAYTEYLSDPRVRREAEALAQRGDSVTVLCLAEAGKPRREVVRGVAIERLGARRYRGGGARQYVLGYTTFFAQAFAWMAMRKAPDVVHVHTIPDALVFAALVPRLRGSRVVLDVHDLTPDLFALKFGARSRLVRLLSWLERHSLRFADAVVTVHEPYAALLAARGVPHARVHVVMNVADETIFGSAPMRSVDVDGGGVHFVYHGALVERYGVDVLLRAFSRVREHVTGARLHVYGGGDFRPRALALAEYLGLNGSVSFSDGYVAVDALPALLARADVGVVPNRANAFTRHILPTKLMEYAWLGVPAIVSRTDTVAPYFSNEMVYYVEPGDVEALASAMTHLANDSALRRELGESIRAFAARHNWHANKQHLYCAIDGAAAHSGGTD
jgi:glycosyltransferase involved in cell wall biosynthesis